jgi:hypothetical protein
MLPRFEAPADSDGRYANVHGTFDARREVELDSWCLQRDLQCLEVAG